MVTYLLLIVGFFLLIKGADLFVDGSSSVAKLLKIPSIIIGLTVVAFGTSMPEASVSITAALQGRNDLAVSNVIGSNIFNLLVVLGASALVHPITVKWSVLKKEFPFSIFITALLILLMTRLDFSKVLGSGNTNVYEVNRIAGVILFGLFVVYVISAVVDALKHRKQMEECGEPEEDYEVLSPTKSAIFIVIGIAGIVFGGNMVVSSASDIAYSFGWSETFVGLTIVALGTSLPELVTSMLAAKKGENDLALGNVVGSNIFNILLILGASATISPIAVNAFAVQDAIILLAASVITYLCAVSKKGLSKLEGVMFLLFYAAFFVYILRR